MQMESVETNAGTAICAPSRIARVIGLRKITGVICGSRVEEIEDKLCLSETSA